MTASPRIRLGAGVALACVALLSPAVAGAPAPRPPGLPPDPYGAEIVRADSLFRIGQREVAIARAQRVVDRLSAMCSSGFGIRLSSGH